ncbi:LacI family DNA-binding transcriptional regulator [Flavimaricola marinus]|uniref:HTH-type transcriptional repressor PurR n=1 Tax=Flavimaricola marinus TaxID=1819565 RepID=A0A238LDY2_9RHOB|nr:LacI family DNA-binding transcriptional regulator [Flavimaricola marinus]SMY07615.1 HTH-type transcriptional repressor PurR [Flavimaricola marinus]
MSITLRDVALRAGVSRSAVSRTFTEGASVSARTRAKVEKAAKELGYSPNVLARSLTTRRTKLIGLVANNFRNPIFLDIFDRFTRGLQDRGLRPLLVNLSDQTDAENSVRLLKQYSVDAVVVASSTLSPNFSMSFHEAGVPVVHAFGRKSDTPRIPIVSVDNVACGRLAARTLISRGYREIGFLGGPAIATSTQDRLAGFSEALAEAEVTPTVDFAEDYSFSAGRQKMMELLQSPIQEAYFCGDDVLSIGAMSAIREAGLRVPEDIGLLGLNDMEMAGWQNIALTTIRQPIQHIVRASIDQIEALLDDPDRAPEQILFDCDIVDRRTLRPLP